ncbi:MAG: 8-oxo-dGTP diphosphatase MutT [Gammaproteobacteria bacterium]|nr:8-oxo-dGTP diphosphatase MutT [Gammaproteobacteria bacterium]MBQ0838297.1 8-oxo-dGTP diphosphatase MutT [Gammaproteobacteria bacterium]
MRGAAKRIHVVAGVIYHPSKQQVLIARRPDHLHQGGLWEFPGGKVDCGENPEQALKRELMEELAIEVGDCSPFLLTEHDYKDKLIVLDVWAVHSFMGQPTGNEGQRVCWVDISALSDYEFPAANYAVLEKVVEHSQT